MDAYILGQYIDRYFTGIFRYNPIIIQIYLKPS